MKKPFLEEKFCADHIIGTKDSKIAVKIDMLVWVSKIKSISSVLYGRGERKKQ